MKLYRPTGLVELGLIFNSGMKAFPPRLPEQPIFYPVLNFSYADQIAREWNTSSHSFAGYVTSFTLEDEYGSQFESHVVGAREHVELWIPAEELEEFNEHIEGRVEVESAHFGPKFTGEIPKAFLMKGLNAIEQFVYLNDIYDDHTMDFACEILAQKRIVFLHYSFWNQFEFTASGLSAQDKADLLKRIAHVWEMSKNPIALPTISNDQG